jgi:hypothetical protein
MDLLKLVNSVGGNSSLQKVAGQLGLQAADAGKLMAALEPALKGGLRRQTSTVSGLASLQKALQNGNHGRYLDRPELLDEAGSREDGNRILGHLFGSMEVSREVAAKASAETGIDVGLIKQALPLLAGLTMAAMGRNSQAKGDASTGSGLAGMLNGGKNDNALGDIMNLARKFF